MNVPRGEIVEAKAKMIKIPFQKCKLVEDKVESIKGLVIKRGIVKEIARRIGGPLGCTHMVEVIQTAIRFSSAILIGLRFGTGPERREMLTEEERRRRSFEVLKGSCIAYSEEES